MKLKNSDLESMVSSPSYQKLFTAEFDDILLVLEIRRQNEELKPALQAYMDTKQTLINRYCDKDPKTGNAISNPGGQFQFAQNPENFEEFRNKYTELLDSEVEVDVEKIRISATTLNSVAKWSGADVSVIYHLIDVFESKEADKKAGKKVTNLKQVPKV